MSKRLVRLNLVALLAVFVLPSLACGNIVLPQVLAVEEPSEITLSLPIFPPPFDMETTSLSGGVETTITANLGFFELLGIFVGQALPANIDVDNIAIAGTEFLIAGGLPTGTICVTLDESLPGGGQALLNPLLGVAQFMLDLNTLILITDPFLGGALGGGGLPFGASIDAITPLSIGDLLGLIAGGAGGLSLTQDIETTLPADTPIIGPATVTATLTLSSADTLPSNALLDECEAFLAGP